METGDRHDLRDLLDPHLDGLRAAAVRLAGSRDAAEDLVQETVVAALAGIGQLRQPEVLGAWLLQILRRTFYHSLRRKTLERRGREAVRPALPSREAAVDADLIRAALRELDPESRRIVELKYFDSKTSEEIARILGKPAGTVRSTLFHALHRFERAYRARLAGEDA